MVQNQETVYLTNIEVSQIKIIFFYSLRSPFVTTHFRGITLYNTGSVTVFRRHIPVSSYLYNTWSVTTSLRHVKCLYVSTTREVSLCLYDISLCNRACTTREVSLRLYDPWSVTVFLRHIPESSCLYNTWSVTVPPMTARCLVSSVDTDHNSGTSYLYQRHRRQFKIGHT